MYLKRDEAFGFWNLQEYSNVGMEIALQKRIHSPLPPPPVITKCTCEKWLKIECIWGRGAVK